MISLSSLLLIPLQTVFHQLQAETKQQELGLRYQIQCLRHDLEISEEKVIAAGKEVQMTLQRMEDLKTFNEEERQVAGRIRCVLFGHLMYVISIDPKSQVSCRTKDSTPLHTNYADGPPMFMSCNEVHRD